MSEYNQPNGEDLFEKPIDRSRQNREEERFRQPVIDREMQEKLKNIPVPDKKTQKLLGIFGLAAVVLLLLFSLLGSLFGPKKAAEKYFKAVLDGKWKAVYQQMEIPEGALMTREHFLAAHPKQEAAEVTNLRIRESGDHPQNENFDEEFMRQYTAFYTVKGEDQPRQMYVQLIRQKEKSLLLFPKWKASSGSMLTKNYPISAPSGYQIIVDGETLTADKTASDENGEYDTYLENIFAGSHVLSASAENREPAEFMFQTGSGSDEYYEVGRLDVSREAVQQMQDTAQEFMRKAYGDALGKNGASKEYLAFWAQTGQNLEDAKYLKESANELYRRLESDLQESYYDTIQFTGLNFSNYQSQVKEEYSDEAGSAYVRLYITYDFDYTYTGTTTSYQGIMTKEEQKNAGTDDFEMTFKSEDGEWKVYRTDMHSVY